MSKPVYFLKNKPQPMIPWTEGMDMTGVSISGADEAAGSPKPGDYIAQNPDNPADRWLIAAEFHAANYVPAPEQEQATDFKSRLIIERDELSDRLDRLQRFLRSSDSDTLSQLHRALLEVQIPAMNNYKAILDVRIRLMWPQA